MARFLVIPPADRPAAAGDNLALAAGEMRHLKTVLRADAVAELDLTDGRGYRYTGRLLSGGKGDPTVEILTAERNEREAGPPLLAVALGVVKGKRFEGALEKACELGAHRIVPLRTEFGVVVPGEHRQERWQSILISALKQCGRCLLPELSGPVSLVVALDEAVGEIWHGASPGRERERAGDRDPADPAILDAAGPPPEILVCIGPEGGWSAAELEMLERAGSRPLDLGPHVLRTETAVAAALTVLQRRRQSFIHSGGGA